MILGVAPLAFLGRAARSAPRPLRHRRPGDSLRSESEPAELRDALARALRDPSLELAFWLPEFETTRTRRARDGAARTRAAPGARRADRARRRTASRRSSTIPALDDEPELLDAPPPPRRHRPRERPPAGGAAGAPRGAPRLAGADRRGRRTASVSRLERNLHDGAQQRLIAMSLELTRLEGQLGPTTPRPRASRPGPARSPPRCKSCGDRPRHPPRRGQRPRPGGGAGQLAARPCRWRSPRTRRAAAPRRSRSPRTTSSARASPMSASTPKRPPRRSTCRGDGVVTVEIVDDGIGGADSERGSGLRGLADRIETLGGRLRVWSPTARARGCARRSLAGSDRRGRRAAARGPRAPPRRRRTRGRRAFGDVDGLLRVSATTRRT